MNVLEELFNTKTEQEIISIYRKYKRNENYISSARLRTAYIQHFLFNEDFKMTSGLFFFIREETYIMGVVKERWSTNEWKEFRKREFSELPEYTRIIPFLNEKLLKEGLLSKNLRWNFGQILVNQSNFLSFGLYDNVFNETMYRIYRDGNVEDKENAIRTLLSFNDYSSDLIRDLREAVREGRAIYSFEEEIFNRFMECERNSTVSSEELSWLREALLSLFAYYYYDNDFKAMQLTYLRLIKILPTTDTVYWTVRFFERELKLTEIE